MPERATEANCRYLDAILEQYHQGRDNRLAYRIAQAAMHTTVMLSWRRWYQICPASRTLPRKFAKPRFAAVPKLRLPAISQPSVLTGSSTRSCKFEGFDDVVCYVDDALHQPADEERQ